MFRQLDSHIIPGMLKKLFAVSFALVFTLGAYVLAQPPQQQQQQPPAAGQQPPPTQAQQPAQTTPTPPPALKFQGEPRYPRDAKEFDELFKKISNWGRWGKDDQLGSVNLITEAKRRQAADLVKRGITVSIAHNPITDKALD